MSRSPDTAPRPPIVPAIRNAAGTVAALSANRTTNAGKARCQGGACVAKAECSADADCSDGKVCEGGRCVAPGQCSLEKVYFGYDDASVDGDAKSTLQRNAECIKERALSVTVTGYCDERGTSEYNIALGERRANNVSKYLQSLGVPKKSLNTLSYGEERLIKECGEEGPESCHRMNRRTEFDVR
ncbi:MAG: OmpA family protein [bacterium]